MSYKPASVVSEEEMELLKQLEPIAQKWAVKLRRADNIDHDPEGQRMKAHIAEACLEAFRICWPLNDGKTVSVTEAPGGTNGKSDGIRRRDHNGKPDARNQGD